MCYLNGSVKKYITLFGCQIKKVLELFLVIFGDTSFFIYLL